MGVEYKNIGVNTHGQIFSYYSYDILVVKNKKINESDNMKIFVQREKLGELKVHGLITEKEFENAKKKLLKKI